MSTNDQGGEKKGETSPKVVPFEIFKKRRAKGEEAITGLGRLDKDAGAEPRTWGREKIQPGERGFSAFANEREARKRRVAWFFGKVEKRNAVRDEIMDIRDSYPPKKLWIIPRANLGTKDGQPSKSLQEIAESMKGGVGETARDELRAFLGKLPTNNLTLERPILMPAEAVVSAIGEAEGLYIMWTRSA